MKHAPRPIKRKLNPQYGVKIVHEDSAIVVIDKPAGLLTVATDKELVKTAYRAVKQWLFPEETNGAYLGVVHRLDRDTSGIMFFVKDDTIRETITRNWQANVVDRRYIAVLEGKPRGGESGTVHNFLKQNKAFRVYQTTRDEVGAEEAITHWKIIKDLTVVKNGKPRVRTLVELKLETGRTNQIRVHMAGLGSPVAGDRKYGVASSDGTWPKRLALHARRIEFSHPTTGNLIAFESPIPPEIKAMYS